MPAALATSHEMIVWGPTPNVCSSSEYTSSDYTGTIAAGAVYDTTSGAWSAIATAGAPVWRNGSLLFTVGRTFVVLGGRGDEGNRHRYDLDAHVWTSNATNNASPLVVSTEGENVPGGFSFTTGFVLGSVIVIVPGQTTVPGLGIQSGGAWLYDASTDKWTATPAFPLEPRNNAAGAVAGGKLVVWGGGSLDATQTFADGAVLDPVVNQWTALPTAGAPSARFLAHAAADPAATSMFVFGGWNVGADTSTTPDRDDGAVFDVGTNNWTAIPAGPNPPTVSERVTTNLRAFGSRLVVLRETSSTMAIFDASTHAWTTFAELPCAAQQGDVAAPMAINKNKLLLAGTGVGGLSLYDLTVGSAINLDGATSPVARTGAVTLWITDRFVVWGGFHYQRTCFGTTPASCQTTGTRFTNGFTLTW